MSLARRPLLPSLFVLALSALPATGCASADEATVETATRADAGGTNDAPVDAPDASHDAAADAPPEVAREAEAEASPDVLWDGGGSAVPPTGNFAVWKVYLGDVGFDDVADPNAWQAFSDDVDGKDSDGTTSDVCTPTGPASSPAALSKQLRDI
jgi:hypothetical protein